jgi:hypothetical protein
MKRFPAWMTSSGRGSTTTTLPRTVLQRRSWATNASVCWRYRSTRLLDVRQLQDLVDGVALAGVDQLHHQLVVGRPPHEPVGEGTFGWRHGCVVSSRGRPLVP